MEIKHICGKVISDELNYCNFCGEKVHKDIIQPIDRSKMVIPVTGVNNQKIIHNCGNEIRANMKFCIFCGGNVDTPQISRPIASQSNTLGLKYPFKWQKSPELSVFLFAIGFSILLLDITGPLLLISIFILFLAYSSFGSNTTMVEYERKGMLFLPLLILIIPIFRLMNGDFTIKDFGMVVLGIIVFSLQPPKYILDNYLTTRKSTIFLIFGVITYYFTEILGIFGYLISILTALYYLFSLHKHLEIPDIKKSETVSSIIPAKRVDVQFYRPQANYIVISNFQSSQQAINIIHEEIISLQTKLIQSLQDIDQIVDKIRNDIDTIYLPSIQSMDLSDPSNSRELSMIGKSQSLIEQDLIELKQKQEFLEKQFTINYSETVLTPLQQEIQKIEAIIQGLQDQVTDRDTSRIKETTKRLELLKSEFSSKVETFNENMILQRKTKEKLIQSSLEEKQAATSVQSLKLRTMISEQLISNLFAYVGAAFLIIGFLFAVSYSYTNYLIPAYPSNTTKSNALSGVGILYLLVVALIAIPSIIQNKLKYNLSLLIKISSTVAIFLLQATLFIQTFYFDNLEFQNSYFLIFGLLGIIITFSLAYLFNSHLISVASIELSLWILFVASTNNFSGSYTITTLYLLLLTIVISFVWIKKFWLPIAIYSLFNPILWMLIQENNANIFLPEILLLAISVTFIFLSMKKRFPTPRPFTQFLTTLFLIYPNLIAINIGIINKTNAELSSLSGTLTLVFVFTSFFILYWVFVLFEGDINISFQLPISYNFKQEQVKFQHIQRKLNSLMLFSLIIFLIMAFVLVDRSLYSPMIYFAFILSLICIIAIKYNFEDFVKRSSILLLLEAELFYFLSLQNPDAEGSISTILSSLFLLVFTLILIVQNIYQREMTLFTSKLSVNRIGEIIAGLSIINFIIGSLSGYQSLVILYSSIIWLIIIHTSLLLPNKDDITRYYVHLSAFAGLFVMFLFGITRTIWGLNVDSVVDHIIINLPIIFYFLYAIFWVIKGNQLLISKSLSTTSTTSKYFDNVISKDRIYLPHIIMIMLPNILVIYGKPYFYFPISNQILLSLYFILYFLTLPILALISKLRKNGSFGTLGSLLGFYSFLLAFILLGGAAKVYQILVKPITGTPTFFMPLEWVVYIFVLIFILTVCWITFISMDLSKESKFSPLNPIERSIDDRPVSDQISTAINKGGNQA